MAWLTATLLVSVRLAAATVMAPVFGPTRIPAPARVALVLALSSLMVSMIPIPSLPPPSFAALLTAVAAEAVIGMAFAFGFIVAYGATQMAGRVLDTQIGFGAAGILNPATQTMSPLLANLLGMLAIATFLAMNGHLLLIKALALSVQNVPPGTMLTSDHWSSILAHSSAMFTFALTLAAPIMGVLLLSDVALAAVARSMPQLNVLVLGFAIKILLGLVGMALSLRLAQGVLEQLFGATFGFWDGLISER